VGGFEVTYAPPAGIARHSHLLLDTHVLVWLMFGDRHLGKQAREAVDHASHDDRILVSAITPWEIGVLVAKNRIDLDREVLEWVRSALSLQGMTLAGLEPEIAVASTRLPFDMHADPADRILVATARHTGATLVTADRTLLDLSKKGHFRVIDASR
jgi:PIN domain nuclease of toxin-antitoxin system